MISNKEIQEIFNAIIKTEKSGHPDPIGYLSRAYGLSGGDIYYHGDDGTIGFYPVTPQLAFEIVGSTDVAGLQNNIISTLSMEIKLIADVGYEAMVITMLSGRKIEDFSEISKLMTQIVYPRQAEVKDVIELLNTFLNDKSKTLTNTQLSFYKKLMEF